MRQTAQIPRQPNQLLAGFLAGKAHHDHVFDRVRQWHHEGVETFDVLRQIHHQQPAEAGVEHAAATGCANGTGSEEREMLPLEKDQKYRL